jgi:predicted RecB family nuclease
MRLRDDTLMCSPSDLASFLACRHRCGLDLAVAREQLTRPVYADSYADLLRQHGEAHERAYVASVRTAGATLTDLTDRDDAAEQTREAMRAGVDGIIQARLEHEGMGGIADLLLRVPQGSDLGDWSYEVHDTKLGRDTTGGTILQLSAYSAMLAHIQGAVPERFFVVTPGVDTPFAITAYRVQNYAAYYRMVSTALRAELANGHEAVIAAYYGDPVETCPLCVWERRCEARRRTDDHLSLIAGIGGAHRVELIAQGYRTLAAVAAMSVPVAFTPARGARETYDRLGHQARVQQQQRTTQTPVVERLPIQAGKGLCQLPAPSQGDVFLDLEGARFARPGGREYLFGVWTMGAYQAWWALNDEEERIAFEAVIDLILRAWGAHPGMHVYHFNHYEPTALKKLMGRHVTGAAELDRLLRAGRFVDLYPLTRQAVRAGVESYSIKQLEQYSGYTRTVALADVHQPLFAVELALEQHVGPAIAPEIREAVQGYNEDDCRSTAVLRDWLEGLRAQSEKEGLSISRPDDHSAEGDKPVPELQQQAVALRARLLATVPTEASQPGHADHARWLLAYLIDWHRREVNAEWWEYFRLKDLSEDELLDERKAVAGLAFLHQVDVVRNKKTGAPTGSVIQRYGYPIQDIEVHGRLKLQDGRPFGEILRHDRDRRIIDVKKGKAMVDHHPSCAFAADVITTDGLQHAVMRLAERVMGGADTCGVQLLLGQPPRLEAGAFVPTAMETAQAFAIRVVTVLDRTVLAIQGPPGAGKTFIGAQMILALVNVGKKVGVVATSHRVIRNLLEQVLAQADDTGQTVTVGAKPGELSEAPGRIVEFDENPAAREAMTGGEVQVLGGTAFLWAREEFADTVDVLVVDEAGQMSLANVLAVSHAANSLVLLGDPQQLNQPEKATHPDGVGISALQHVLGDHHTMPPDRGIFLPLTWRMSPTLTAFTSEVFYEGKLEAKAGLEGQRLDGTGDYDGSRLWLIPVAHDGNQSASMEEVDAIDALIQTLLTPGAHWVDEHAVSKPLTGHDLRVVAPFNAQVNRLTERLAGRHVPVGTVDKFQGQTAAVVIYSMTTSRPEDAPRGMEFLYSLNRLNVATSRARCAVFLVASPTLFAPACRTPRQLQLANAMCRYREMAAMADKGLPVSTATADSPQVPHGGGKPISSWVSVELDQLRQLNLWE